MIRQMIWSAIIMVSSGLLIAAVQAGSSTPGRTIITLWCFLVCPGMAYIQSLHIEHAPVRWTLAIALSISIDILVALAILYGGIWDYKLGMFAILTITWLGVGISIMHTWMGLRHKVPSSQSEVLQ